MTTGRTEYLRGYQDALDGKTADPPPEAEAFPCVIAPVTPPRVLSKSRVGAVIEAARATMWYEQGTRAKLIQGDGYVWEADFAGQGNRSGSFMRRQDGTARWHIAECDFEVIG